MAWLAQPLPLSGLYPWRKSWDKEEPWCVLNAAWCSRDQEPRCTTGCTSSVWMQPVGNFLTSFTSVNNHYSSRKCKLFHSLPSWRWHCGCCLTQLTLFLSLGKVKIISYKFAPFQIQAHLYFWSKYHMWKSLENPCCFFENGFCLLQPCSYQYLVSSLGIIDLYETGTIFGNRHNRINNKQEGKSQWNVWKFMGEMCLDRLPENSIKKHSPSDQLFYIWAPQPIQVFL